MKWHDHPMLWKATARAGGLPIGKPLETVQLLLDAPRFHRPDLKLALSNTAIQMTQEANWCLADCPYYDLYPSIAQAFLKVPLETLDCSLLHLPLPQLLIRFQVGHELALSPRMKARTIFATEMADKNGRGWLIAINDGSTMPANYVDVPIHTVNGTRLVPGSTIADHLRIGREQPYCDDEVDDEAVDNAVRIVCTMCLLKDEPDLIEPQPLEADRAKWEATHDSKYIEKAARRGKRGWSVGAKIEVAPGFRRPHFAIRWCGKGRTDPRLRPIKGCLVNRKKITEIPTDYLGYADDEHVE